MITVQQAKDMQRRLPKSRLPPFSKASKSTAKDSGDAAYTFNWDTVFSITFPDVNKAIIEGSSSPDSFKQYYEDPDFKFTASGTFGDWQLCQGGGGKLLHMSVPLTAAVLQFEGCNPINLGPVNLTIEIKLHYLPHTDESSVQKEGLRRMKLVPRATTDKPSDPVVICVTMEFSNGDTGIIADSCFQTGIVQWLNENLDTFSHIFAVVDISDIISEDDQWQFTTPSYTSYACLSKDTLDDCIFAVLSMTGGRTGEQNSEQVSWASMTEGHRAAYLISQDRFLMDLVRPSIVECYDGLEPDQLELWKNKQTLALKEGESVQLNSVENDGKTYDPVLKMLEITANPEELMIKSQTFTEISSGITSECNATLCYRIVLKNQSDGKQTLMFEQSNDPDVEHITHKDVGVIIGEIIAGLITAVGVVVAGALTSGAAFIAAAACVGLVGGPAISSPDIIAACGTDDAPPIDALVINATNPITWPSFSGFTQDWVGLIVSFQLEGALNV